MLPGRGSADAATPPLAHCTVLCRTHTFAPSTGIPREPNDCISQRVRFTGRNDNQSGLRPGDERQPRCSLQARTKSCIKMTVHSLARGLCPYPPDAHSSSVFVSWMMTQMTSHRVERAVSAGVVAVHRSVPEQLAQPHDCFLASDRAGASNRTQRWNLGLEYFARVCALVHLCGRTASDHLGTESLPSCVRWDETRVSAAGSAHMPVLEYLARRPGMSPAVPKLEYLLPKF